MSSRQKSVLLDALQVLSPEEFAISLERILAKVFHVCITHFLSIPRDYISQQRNYEYNKF